MEKSQRVSAIYQTNYWRKSKTWVPVGETNMPASTNTVSFENGDRRTPWWLCVSSLWSLQLEKHNVPTHCKGCLGWCEGDVLWFWKFILDFKNQIQNCAKQEKRNVIGYYLEMIVLLQELEKWQMIIWQTPTYHLFPSYLTWWKS